MKEELPNQRKITVYTTKAWGEDGWSVRGMWESWRCRGAKNLLESEGYPLKVIDVTNNVELRAKLAYITETQELPQVFLDDSLEPSSYRGGYANVLDFYRRAALPRLLRSDSFLEQNSSSSTPFGVQLLNSFLGRPRGVFDVFAERTQGAYDRFRFEMHKHQQDEEYAAIEDFLATAARLSLLAIIVCMTLIAALWFTAVEFDWPVGLAIVAAIVLICAGTIGTVGVALSSSSADPYDRKLGPLHYYYMSGPRWVRLDDYLTKFVALGGMSGLVFLLVPLALLNGLAAGLIVFCGILLAFVAHRIGSLAGAELQTSDIFSQNFPLPRCLQDVPLRTTLIGMLSIVAFVLSIGLALSPGLNDLQLGAAVGTMGAVTGFWLPRVAKKSASGLVLSLLAVPAVCFFVIFSMGLDKSTREILLTLLGALLLAGFSLLNPARGAPVVFLLLSPICLYIIFSPAIFEGPGFDEYTVKVSTLFLATSLGLVLKEPSSLGGLADRVARRAVEIQMQELEKEVTRERQEREQAEERESSLARELEMAERSKGFWRRRFGG